MPIDPIYPGRICLSTIWLIIPSEYSPVIASEAKQSIEQQQERMDCFVASLLAMTDPSWPQRPQHQIDHMLAARLPRG
jgi:hypothetical protein